ncbi:tetratricopeptide repeat protein [Sphingobacteriaceae bacterium AH-315-L07]|nr:tetratricopeptide repeat protein [Sphingobacteriaceae bacterium AH-315-L07]
MKLIKKILFLPYLLFIVIQFSVAQEIPSEAQAKLDSLQSAYENIEADTLRVNLLNRISWQLFILGEYEAALQKANESLTLAEKLNYPKGIARSYNHIGVIYRNQSDYPNALKYHLKSLKIKEELGDKSGISASQ